MKYIKHFVCAVEWINKWNPMPQTYGHITSPPGDSAAHSSLQATESLDSAAPGSPSWSPVLTLVRSQEKKVRGTCIKSSSSFQYCWPYRPAWGCFPAIYTANIFSPMWYHYAYILMGTSKHPFKASSVLGSQEFEIVLIVKNLWTQGVWKEGHKGQWSEGKLKSITQVTM